MFVTAYDDRAVRAFEVRALDYLLKPFSPERFHEVLGHACERLRAKPRQLAQLVTAQRPYLTRLLVEGRGKAHFLPVQKVVRLESDRNYELVYAGGAEHLLRTTLTALVERLDPTDFLRINRSEVIRLDAVAELRPWSHGDWRVLMTDGAELTWSRRFRSQAEGLFGPQPTEPD
ncbi:MAG: response regulator transcription factor [Archangiaceae bacterium]|nr:response regulator transcription factor [Archangiaceae bacterium]